MTNYTYTKERGILITDALQEPSRGLIYSKKQIHCLSDSDRTPFSTFCNQTDNGIVTMFVIPEKEILNKNTIKDMVTHGAKEEDMYIFRNVRIYAQLDYATTCFKLKESETNEAHLFKSFFNRCHAFAWYPTINDADIKYCNVIFSLEEDAINFSIFLDLHNKGLSKAKWFVSSLKRVHQYRPYLGELEIEEEHGVENKNKLDILIPEFLDKIGKYISYEDTFELEDAKNLFPCINQVFPYVYSTEHKKILIIKLQNGALGVVSNNIMQVEDLFLIQGRMIKVAVENLEKQIQVIKSLVI